MRRKIINILPIIILLFFSIITSIKVEAANNDSFYNAEYLNNIYIKKVKGYTTRYETGRIIRRMSDDKFSYCLQPFIDFVSGKVNIAYDTDYEIVTNMTKEKWERISLLAYYGYGYKNHTDKNWYIITQMLIWKTVDSSDMYFTDTLNGNRISIFENEIKELENLVAKHHLKPSFNNSTINISLGETIKLEDNNQVIDKYTVLKNDNISASINDNSLLVRGIKVGTTNLILENKDKKYSSPPIVYVNNTNQDLMVVGSYETIISKINFNVLAGKIRISKLDSETNKGLPLGEGSLEGAQYQILNSNNEVVETVTTSSTGVAISSYLPLGKYTIKEIIPSKGYNLDEQVYSIEIKENKIYEIISKEKVIKGNIEITKLNSETETCEVFGEAVLEGAVYAIYDYGNNLVDEVTINKNCKGLSKKLPYGTYKIKEIKAPNGYEIDTNIYQIKIEKDTVYRIISKEKIIKGNIEITKVDSETGICKALGEAALEGTTYAIYDSQNNLIDEIVIDENCQGTSKELYYGTYKIKEVTPGVGYKLSDEIKEISIVENEKYFVTLKNEVIKNKIEIYKFIENSDTGFLALESGAVFEVINNNEVIKTIETNSDGYVTFDLPYGNYEIKQIKGNKYYKLISPFNIKVDETTKTTQQIYLRDKNISAKLKLTKIDSESKLPILLKGIKFKIKSKQTNEYLCQITNQKICEFETDDKGIMLTPLELYGGIYIIEEIETGENYLLSNKIVEVEILKENIKEDELYGSIVEVNFENEQIKGSLEINKKGETKDKYISLENITYSLYAAEDIITKDGIIHYLKDELIDTLITDKDGISRIDNLYLGKYYFKETKTNDNYILDENKYYFELTNKDNKKQYNLINYLKKGDLEIKKIDEYTKKELENVEFGIYDINDNLIRKEKTNYMGIINIDNLIYGKYYIKELNTKDEYHLNDEKIYFEIDKSLTKIVITNKQIAGNLKVTKVGEDNKPLKNVVFGLYNLEDILLEELITNEEGIALSKKIPYGKYYLLEIKTNDNYILDNEKRYFEIKNNNETIELNIKNNKKIIEKEPIIIEVPDTLSDTFNIQLVIIILLIYFYGKKKH